MNRLGRRLRSTVFALGILLLAGLLAPHFLSAGRYRSAVTMGLSSALGRPVSFGEIELDFIPRPGFSVHNLVIGEDPSFGMEPFAQVEKAKCTLAWKSLFSSRVTCSEISLDGAVINLVRVGGSGWNVDSLLSRGGAALSKSAPATNRPARQPLRVGLTDSRLNFVLGGVKIPLAIGDLRGELNRDAESGAVHFQLKGIPFRADLTTSEQGEVALRGIWRPSAPPSRRLAASFETRNGLLCDWIPLMTGRSPNVYGVLDASATINGSWQKIEVAGKAHITDLHALNQPPLPRDLPVSLEFSGAFDRAQETLLVQRAEGQFGRSTLTANGTITGVPSSTPQVQLNARLIHCRLVDFAALERRLVGGRTMRFRDGIVDGTLSVAGPWAARQYAGKLTARKVRLSTVAGVFPISTVALQVEHDALHFAGAQLALAPGLIVEANGTIERESDSAPDYDINLRANRAPIPPMLALERRAGDASIRNVRGSGFASVEVNLRGPLWPPTRPSITAVADLRDAAFRISPLATPLKIEQAHLTINARGVLIRPLRGALGSSQFTGLIWRAPGHASPWRFDVTTHQIDLTRVGKAFNAARLEPRRSFIWGLPGFRELFGRADRSVSPLPARNALGIIRARRLIFRRGVLNHVVARVELRPRRLAFSPVTFDAGAGRGKATLALDWAKAPARLVAAVALANASLARLHRALPSQLRQIRGRYRLQATFTSAGRSIAEFIGNFRGSGEFAARNVSFGSYDPVASLETRIQGFRVTPSRHAQNVKPLVAKFLFAHDRLILTSCPLQIGQTRLWLAGDYDSAKGINLLVSANLPAPSRVATLRGVAAPSRTVKVRLIGPLARPTVAPSTQVRDARR